MWQRWRPVAGPVGRSKTKSYQLGHNFGHGQQNLAAVLAILNPLSFTCHTVCELTELTWWAAKHAIGTRRGFFQGLRAITTDLVFPP